MAKRKASNKQLQRHTHKGRASKSGSPNVQAQGGRGVRATGLRGDPREAAAAMTRISPTPHGVEPHWPGGA